MRSSARRLWCLSLFLVLVPRAAAQTQGDSKIIADFDHVQPAGIVTYDDVVSVESAEGANGRSLKITPGQAPGAKPGLVVRFTDVTLPTAGHFRCSLKVSSK